MGTIHHDMFILSERQLIHLRHCRRMHGCKRVFSPSIGMVLVALPSLLLSFLHERKDKFKGLKHVPAIANAVSLWLQFLQDLLVVVDVNNVSSDSETSDQGQSGRVICPQLRPFHQSQCGSQQGSALAQKGHDA